MSMSNRHQYLTRLITVRYAAALALIGLFLTASLLIVNRAVEFEREGYRVVGMVSEQRVASQRIPFLANAYAREPDAAAREIYRNTLHRIVWETAKRHELLTTRSRSMQIPEGMRSILADVYYGQSGAFDAQVRRFLESARSVVNAEGNGLHPDPADLVQLNLAGGGYILQTYGLLARLLRQEAIQAFDRIYALYRVLWILTLLLIALEVPLIFQPMARRAAKSLEKTEEARVRAESEALAAQTAHEAQASFIRTMSHELRTPLNAILGLNQLMRMGVPAAKQAEYMEDIDQAGRHLLYLIDDVLEFSRLEAGHVIIHKARISLKEEMERTATLLQPLAVKKGLALDLRLDPDLAVHYRADGLRIRQILVNIAGNAIKFTERGSIAMRALFAGSPSAVADLVRFEVQDTGIGVPPDAFRRIFEEFQQADYSLARRYGGSGLGLAISSRLVDLMGGEIGVESNSRGSLFWFTLPLERDDLSDETGDGATEAEAPSPEMSA